MSQIPTFQSSVPIPRPDTSGQQAIAGAIGNVGGQLGELAIQMQRVKNADEANTLAIQSHDEAAQILSDAALVQGGNIDAAEQQAIQKLNELRDRQIGAASNDRVRSSVYRNIGTSIAQSQASVRGHFNKIRIDDSKKLGAISSFNNAKEYVAAATQKGRDIVRDKEFARIDDDPHLREGQQAVAKHEFMEDIIPRLGKEGERLTYNKMMANGDFEKAIDLMDSVEYMPAVEVRENRNRAIKGARVKIFKDEGDDLKRSIDPKDLSNLPSLISQAKNRISQKSYIKLSDPDITAMLIDPLITRAADAPDTALYNALNAFLPHTTEGDKIRNRVEDIFKAETKKANPKRDELKELTDLFMGEGSLKHIPISSEIVNQAVNAALALRTPMSEIVTRLARENIRYPDAISKPLDRMFDISATPEDTIGGINMLLTTYDINGPDRAYAEMADFKHNADVSRIIFDAARDASSQEEIAELVTLFNTKSARKNLVTISSILRNAGKKNSKGKPIVRPYSDQEAFFPGFLGKVNTSITPGDRESFDSAYIKATVEVMGDNPESEFENLTQTIFQKASKFWRRDNLVVKTDIGDTVVRQWVIDDAQKPREEALLDLERGVNNFARSFVAGFRRKVETSAAFRTADGTFMPIRHANWFNEGEMVGFLRWDAASGTGSFIEHNSSTGRQLSAVMRSKIDPRRLRPYADLRWDESYGDKSAQDVDKDLPQKIINKAKEIFEENNDGPPRNKYQLERYQRYAESFVNRLGWIKLSSDESSGDE